MPNKSQNQNAPSSIDPTATGSFEDVQFWREEFRKLAAQFSGTTAVADALGPLDPDFAHGSGYVRVVNLFQGRCGIKLTAKAVRLLKQMPGVALPQPPAPDPLKRQGLVKKR